MDTKPHQRRSALPWNHSSFKPFLLGLGHRYRSSYLNSRLRNRTAIDTVERLAFWLATRFAMRSAKPLGIIPTRANPLPRTGVLICDPRTILFLKLIQPNLLDCSLRLCQSHWFGDDIPRTRIVFANKDVCWAVGMLTRFDFGIVEL
jgi:hypothetical protein